MAILTAETPVGYELPLVARKFRLEHFKRGEEKTIHTDVDAARREGLPAPVAIGPQVASLIFKQLRACFERGWIEGGRCALTFRRPVYVTDFCVAKGVVVRREEVTEGVRLHCDVWIENQAGDKVIVGTASGLVSRRGEQDR
ncbi:MAG: MaoC family dehydratase [Betaproteobacteria bacterium]|nr:MaoC family dehydratase [Betaproteobacteria bacterium]